MKNSVKEDGKGTETSRDLRVVTLETKESGDPPRVENVNIGDLSMERRVELLNALAKIKKSPPRVKNFDAQIQYIIIEAFYAWIDRKMLSLMGGSAGASPEAFTDVEIGALKALAARVLEKAPQKSQNPEVPRPQPKAIKDPVPAAQPPSLDSEKWRKAQQGFLDQLHKMDQSGPEF